MKGREEARDHEQIDQAAARNTPASEATDHEWTGKSDEQEHIVAALDHMTQATHHLGQVALIKAQRERHDREDKQRTNADRTEAERKRLVDEAVERRYPGSNAAAQRRTRA